MFKSNIGLCDPILTLFILIFQYYGLKIKA